MFIGVYNLANLITLMGLASAVLACVFAQHGFLRLALCMFLLSGLCDMFDGRIARGAGSRTRKEKVFGIQIDTVCDMVSFGVAPAAILYFSGSYNWYDTHVYMNEWYDVAAYVIYVACAAIRLAYFNTQAIEETPDLNMKAFTGVPVPASCVLLPPLLILRRFLNSPQAIHIVFDIAVIALGLAFILKIKVRKLNIIESVFLILFELVCVILMFLL